MKFQIRGAEGFNRVYVPFITPRVVNIETHTSASAFGHVQIHLHFTVVSGDGESTVLE